MFRRIALTSVLLATFCGLCEAAKKSAGPPAAISHLLPSGGKAGSTFSCSIGGTLAKTENKTWTDHPGIVFKPTAKPEVFEVSIAPDVPPGPHLVRFYNEDGASPPHVFVVGKCDEAADTEPNDDFHKPQQLAKIPVTVNGVLAKAGDVDTFAFQVDAGRRLTLDLQGYSLGSQMDPAMKLLDDRGVEVTMSHDTFNLDPFIALEVKKTGTYMAQVMAFAHPPAADVTLKGSPDHVYRLTFSDQPFARFATPCAVQRGQQATVSTRHGECKVDASKSIASERRIVVPTPDGELVFGALVSAPVTVEKEPNDEAKTAQRVTAPFAVSGVISKSGDEDHYIFTAKKGDSLSVRVHAVLMHSPLDATLRIEDFAGKVVQQDDDSGEGNPDPEISFRPSADGDYMAVVGDLYHRGTPDFCYALEVSPPSLQVIATLTDNSLKLDAGKTVDLKTSVKITGKLQGKVLANVDGLPPGITCKEVEVPPKGGELKLALSAVADTPASSGPIEVRLTTSAPDEPMIFKGTYDLRGTEPRGDRLINEDSRVWLTVTPAPVKPAPAAASGPSASPKPPAAAPPAKP